MHLMHQLGVLQVLQAMLLLQEIDYCHVNYLIGLYFESFYIERSGLVAIGLVERLCPFTCLRSIGIDDSS